MTEQKYIFHIGAYDIETLVPQISDALNKRSELLSREQYPVLWRSIDKVNAIPKSKRQHGPFWKLLYLFCAAAGIFLFIPGLMKPQELTTPLIVGGVAIAFGVKKLWDDKKDKQPRHLETRYDEAARQLLQGKDSISEENHLEVRFTPEGMCISSDSSTSLIVYSSFECIIETEAAYLLVYDELVTILQKRDMVGGTAEELREFLCKRIERYHTVS